MVQHHTHEPLGLSALIEIGPELQDVWFPDGDDQVLVHARGTLIVVLCDGAHLLVLVGEVRGVAWGDDGVSRVGDVGGDPGVETAFEPTVADDVVGGCGSTARGYCRCCAGGCLGGHGGQDWGSAGTGGAVAGWSSTTCGRCAAGEPRGDCVDGGDVGCADGGVKGVDCWAWGGEESTKTAGHLCQL